MSIPPELFLGASLAVTLAAAGVALLLLRRAHHREVAHFDDLDALLITLSRLPGADEREAGDLACGVLAQIADASQAILYRTAEPVLAVGGQAGVRGEFPTPSTDVLRALVTALRDGLVCQEPLVIPVVDGRRVLGAVHVSSARRRLDGGALAALALVGRQLGPALGAIRRASSNRTAQVDAVTGVWSEREAPALVDSAQIGDALAIITFAEVLRPKARADVLMGALAMSLRASLRPTDDVARCGPLGFVIVLRDVRAPVEQVLHRVLESWVPPVGTPTVHGAGVLHLDSSSPVETFQAAQRAIEVSQRRPGGDAVIAIAV